MNDEPDWQEFQEDLFCKLFVDANINASALAAVIVDLVDGQVDARIRSGRVVNTAEAELSVCDNEDHNHGRKRDRQRGFLFFPYYLEVDAFVGQSEESQIKLVSRLLQGLWAKGFRAVAACNFEDKLPINRRR